MGENRMGGGGEEIHFRCFQAVDVLFVNYVDM